MVAPAGLEPASPYGRQILSLLCMPIPPQGLRRLKYSNTQARVKSSMALSISLPKVVC